MSSSDLPETHAEFVDQFVETAAEYDGFSSHDGNDVGISKRQKLISKAAFDASQEVAANKPNAHAMTAPEARYGLGGDDNLYLQLGLSVLHTASPNRMLAPAALYSVDVVHAIREAIAQNVASELKQRRKDANDKNPQVLKLLKKILIDDGLADELDKDDAQQLKLQINGLSTTFDGKYYTKLLKDLDEFLDSRVASSIELDVAYQDDAEEPPPAIAVSAPAVVQYALSRGLCGHRGPSEAQGSGATDTLLRYSASRNIMNDVAQCARFRIPDHARAVKTATRHDDAGIDEAMAALGGNYAIDDALEASAHRNTVKDARQVRWEPTGEHAVALARSAAYEHAIARCGQLLDDPASTLSAAARTELGSARMCLKLKQLEDLHELACALEDGEVLHSPPPAPMVTRPTATIRSKMHLAHDAGHHRAPATTTVLADARWTQEHIRADAAFRKESTSKLPIYKAPTADELGYIPITTAAPPRVEYDIKPSDMRYLEGGILEALRKLVEYGLYYADVPEAATVKTAIQNAAGASAANPIGTAESRRSGIWNEMLRDIAVSTDRLWTFVRTLSGLIGEDADGLLVTADEATASAARDLRAQRKATADRVAAFQGRLVESLVGSMMRESGLRLDTDAQDAAEALVVVNKDTAKQINDLASGESGRPFFEANVALRALADRGNSGKHRLGDVVAQVNGVVRELHQALDSELQSPATAGASLAELSTPRNSYFVKIKDDCTAAIRSSFDKFTVECSVKGVGRIALWELVEGADHTLCTRFAELVGHVLVQNRTSTGVAALYTSRQQLMVNSTQSQVALQRLINHGGHYRSSYPRPDFGEPGTTDLRALRSAYFGSHQEQAESWTGGAAAVAIKYAHERHLKHVERVARPGDTVAPNLRKWVHGYH